MTTDDIRQASVIPWLASVLPSLPRSEQRVARVILSDPATAAHLTISALASLASTSETTVTRLCRSINVDSYPALRIALATETGRTSGEHRPLSSDIEPGDDLDTIVAKVSSTTTQAITDTARNLNVAALHTVIEAVAAARRVDAYGVGASGHVAGDLQQKLHRIGLTAYAWTNVHTALTSAANLTAADVAIGFSHSGTTIDVIAALTEARARGARTVAVTNFSRSPVVAHADIALFTSATEMTLRSGAMVSRIAALTVVDCLFLAVAHKLYPASIEAIERTQQAVNSRHQTRH